MKKSKETMALKASQLREEIEVFCKSNSLVEGNLSLTLGYNHYHNNRPDNAYTYVLKTNVNGSSIYLTFKELQNLKDFLNKIEIIS